VLSGKEDSTPFVAVYKSSSIWFMFVYSKEDILVAILRTSSPSVFVRLGVSCSAARGNWKCITLGLESFLRILALCSMEMGLVEGILFQDSVYLGDEFSEMDLFHRFSALGSGSPLFTMILRSHRRGTPFPFPMFSIHNDSCFYSSTPSIQGTRVDRRRADFPARPQGGFRGGKFTTRVMTVITTTAARRAYIQVHCTPIRTARTRVVDRGVGRSI